ncbi:MAG: septal ring lytic transglycosylase RlpA family protein [Rhodospirillaceae bacterium]|nr:septal ring lytic transglycosylase RlpA family protein [Rhodospirillaceae bacterium]
MYKRLSILILALFVLGACAETQLLVHTAKQIGRSTKSEPTQQGRYKIGNPYQIKGVWYYPAVDYGYNKTGIASWYGPGFHGKRTANGETYDQNALTAAHKTLPMPSIVQVTNLDNGRSIKVTVNDRGPYAYGRVIDMSRRGAQLLGFHRKGTARVRVTVLADESRMLAQQIKSGAVLAKIGTPIRRDIDVAKPGVASETLLPPQGAKKANRPTPRFTPRETVVASRQRVTDTPTAPNGIVSTGPVKPTNMFVQAGAFTRYDFANRTVARLSELGNVKITTVKIRGKEFYRVRAGPIGALENADHVLERIIRAGFSNARIVVD